jgi:hypothetical protein
MHTEGPHPVSETASVRAEDAIEAATLAYLREVYDDPAIITGWVVIAEFVDSKGTPDLHAFAATGMPYWKINGMLDAAPSEIAYTYDDDDEDDD